MNGEVENDNKKKQKVTILIGVVTLLIAVLGATYAYFQISTDNESSNTTITGKTPPKSLVTLKNVTSNLHLNISASDMSYENRTKEYYGTDGEESYEVNENDGTKTIAQVELTGGEATTKYSCTAKLIVSKVTEPDAEKDTMIEVLQPGDMILQFKGNIISEKLDLSELKSTGSKEYDLSFKVKGNTPEEIQAYIKLTNKSTPQNYLSGKKLNIDISTSELKCDIAELETIDKLRRNDTQGYLSSDLQGEMYRYQGTPTKSEASNMTNWICFGTTNKDECIKEPGDSKSVPEGIDKYMYRIIGITEEGQMYLIKETFLKDLYSSGNYAYNTFGWDAYFQARNEPIYGCSNGICPVWGENTLFKRINGVSNGEIYGINRGFSDKTYDKPADNDIFVDNEYYDYLKSGDGSGTNNNLPSKWYSLIAYHSWMYGDIGDKTTLDTYNGQQVYAIETGQADVKHYTGTFNNYNEETYRWTQRVIGKINLMYIHDYLYAYPGGNPENASNAKNSWIYLFKDGYNISYYDAGEWFSTRYGLDAPSPYVYAWNVGVNDIEKKLLSGAVEVGVQWFSEVGDHTRPVFYLSSNAKIKSGNGTKSNPYILDVQE